MITFEKSVGAVIFRRTKYGVKFLLLDHGGNYWNYPKGHVEKGENEEQTLKREVEEETGMHQLEIIHDFRHKNHYFYRAKRQEKAKRKKAGRAINIVKTVVYYLVEAKDNAVKLSDEHVGYTWLDYEKALEKVTYKSSQKILSKAWKILQEKK